MLKIAFCIDISAEYSGTCIKRSPSQISQVTAYCLLSFCLNTTYFVFEGTYYQQVIGTAMGSPVSAVIASLDLVMEDVEQRALVMCHGKLVPIAKYNCQVTALKTHFNDLNVTCYSFFFDQLNSRRHKHYPRE